MQYLTQLLIATHLTVECLLFVIQPSWLPNPIKVIGLLLLLILLSQTEEFTLNGEWELCSTTAEWRETVLSCCPLTRYPYVQFALRLRRRYAFYVLNVIVPCALLSVLAMIGFCLPPGAGEKVSLGISVVLAIIVFLLLLAETVPRTSLHVPIIGRRPIYRRWAI